MRKVIKIIEYNNGVIKVPNHGVHPSTEHHHPH